MQVRPGTRAIVSGATRGIGRVTARALAERGARVGLIARGEEELSSFASELDDAVPLPADVGDRESVAAALERFIEQTGGLDVAVANAGVAEWAPFTELDPERADEMVRINLTGTLNLIRAALPPMLDRGRGHVVVVSSSAALRAFPWTAVYSATKAGQKAFAEGVRHELSGTGVSLTTVFPGEVRTSLHAHEMDRRPDWYRPSDAIPPEIVARAIIEGIEKDRREVHVPGQVRLLALNDIAPGLVDRLLALLRGGAAAPRRY